MRRGLATAIVAVTTLMLLGGFIAVFGSVLATLLVIASYSRSLVELFTFILLISTSAILLPYAASSAAWLRSGGGPCRQEVAARVLQSSSRCSASSPLRAPLIVAPRRRMWMLLQMHATQCTVPNCQVTGRRGVCMHGGARPHA